ncbi:protein artichoke-like [Liolophura sinensis]|uniref:protein artichoke-like n=1 Tax=Liolophura sinensis TaxID=3198878 RepID=UPI003159701A
MRNKLTHLLPETFAGLTNLYGLSLHDNRLREIGPRMFVGLSKVTFIFLSLNKLTLINRDAFVDFPVLNYLNLTGNAIRNMQAGSFRNLSSLSTLDLSGNQLIDIGPDVFFNVSRLRALHLENNQISFLSEVLFYVIKNSLREVNLKSNELSSTSWKWLGKLLGHLKGLRMLDLSHNPLKYIPADVIPTLATMLEVRLRNCSLDKVPDNAWNVSLDLSMNNIQGPLLLRNSHTASSRLNVSNNKITALNVKIPYRNNHYTDNLIVCDNNQIQDSLVIEVEHPTEFSDRSYIKVSAKHNFINEAIQFLFHEKQDGDVSLRLNADLSFNTYVNVTKLPVDIKVKPGGEVLIPGGRSAPVVFRNYEITLNLSNNAISYISPEACLGIVYKLDLRNNRLEVFGDLMPKTDSPEYKLQYLYLSGNRLHRVTTETFDRYELLYHLDLRDNDIISLNSFNISNRFPELFLTGNPLTCGCEIAGLRNGTMPDKIDLVRCHSPRAFTGYLAVCFPLSACSSSVSVSVSDKTRWLCEQDSNIKLSNLTVTVENGVVSVTWTKTGPGMMTGYRVKYHPVNDIGMGGSTLVHPETEKVLLDDLSMDTTYNICVFAVVRSRRKGPAVCTGIPVISARNETPFAEGGVVIGLASALGLCVLLAGAVTICLCVRKRRSGQNQPNDSSLDTEPGYSQSVSTNPAYVPTNVSAQAEPGEINSVNIRHPNNESQTEDGNIYERINRSTAHENSGFRA